MTSGGLDGLKRRLETQPLLEELCEGLSGLVPADRVGVCVPNEDGSELAVVALWDRGEPGSTRPAYAFSSAGSVGEWVRQWALAFVGNDLEDVKGYPTTHESMAREQFRSNCVLPMELGEFGRGAMFLLSRRRGSFGPATLAVAARLRGVVEPAVRARLALSELRTGGALDDMLEGSGGGAGILNGHARANGPGGGPGDSLAEVERRHVEHVLRQTNGLIEGPRGAARVLGLNPSTLRTRMKRLGVQRYPGT